RETSEALPAPASEREVALRDAPSAAGEASPAPGLDLGSESLGAPTTAARTLGMPARAERQRSLGSPAAGPTSGSVAEAAPETTNLAAPSSRASDVELPSRAGAARALALRDGSEQGAARRAEPAAALDLGLASAGTVASSRTERSGAPERASETRTARASDPASPLANESVAESAVEIAPEGVAALGRSTVSSSTPSRSRSSNAATLDPSAGESVASTAGEAPALGLESLARVPSASAATSGRPSGGPQRATGTNATPRPAADAGQAGESLAARGAAPSVGLPRAPGAVSERAPTGERREVALADVPASVARPAESGGSEAAKDWLQELGAPSPGRASSSVPLARGPERAAALENRGRAATPLAENAPSLARAAEAPREDQPKPAKSDWDSTPYQNRSGAEKARALKLYGGSEKTEAAVARGLQYLARIQHQEGAWGDLSAVDDKYGRVAVGKTALCTLAFLGAGHTPDSGTEHSAVVARALEFLLGMQDSESGHFGDASAYDHGIATYAIAECFALTHDARLRSALERALAHVLAMQSTRDDARFRGGWGYYFADGSHYDPWPRTSITVWQVMALESARLSGLDVPDAAFEAARGFLDNAEDERLGAYRYNHEPERLASAWPTLPASTPAALFALALLGEDIADEHHRAAREYVLERVPDGYRYSGENDFVQRGRGNPYFWYYGTLAMFRLGGTPWQQWNSALQESLLPAQARDGSWQPLDVYSRYARDGAEDKSYTTSLCILSLEVYYRYYLPLLKVR
ncbi:MAG TPA: hypothetical protein VM509_03140, partial [Planctomycetota bacterium]|nr:hypothetical protein [Planctomycetota bacterium]